MTEATIDKVEEKPAHRELVFENIGADKENLSLMINDRPPKGVRASSKHNYYKIPLYQAQSREHSDEAADVELVHICPKRFAQASNKITDHQHWLRDGFLYIFIDGYLWRELQVNYDENTHTTEFSDVNLRVQKGEQFWKKNKGEREATGEQLKTILVPYKLQGKECQVEVAYAEVQWGWRQIQAFGGMNPNDPRLNGHEAVKVDEADKEEAAQRRAMRMTKLTALGQYQQGYSNQQHPAHLVLPFSNPQGVYNPIVEDEIGRAREAAKEVSVARKTLELLQVSSALEQPLPLGKTIPKPSKEQAGKHVIAQTIQNQFFAFPQNVADKIATIGEDQVNEVEAELASDYKKWAEDSLHSQDLRQYLNTDDALKVAHYINEIKTKAFDIITNEEGNGSFYQAISDYAYFKDSRRLDIYEVISDVIAPLKDGTADLIKHFVINAADQRQLKELSQQDMGQETLLKVIGSHLEDIDNRNNMLKLVKLLFPKQTGEKLTDYESYADPDLPFDITFDVDDFKAFNQEQGNIEAAGFQSARRGLQVVWGLLNIALEVPTTMYVMNKHNQPFKTTYAMQLKNESALKVKQENLDEKGRQLEKEIFNKQAEISAIEAHKQKMYAEISAQGLDPKQAEATLTAIIKQRQQELEGLKAEAQQAKHANIRTRQHIANLQSAGQDLLSLEGSVKIKDVAVRQNPYVKFKNLSHLVTNGLLVEIDIDVNEYVDGKVPEGMLPLNFTDRVTRAKNKLADFNRLATGFDDAITSTDNAPKARLNINNKHSIQTRLDHLINLDGSLTELEHMLDKQMSAAEQGQQVLQRKLLVIDGSKLTEETITLKKIEKELNKQEGDKIKADWDGMTYKAHRKALSRYKNFDVNPKLFDKAFSVMLPFVAAMEVVNCYSALSENGGWGRNQISALADLADIMMSIGRSIAEKRVGLPTNKQVQMFIKSKGVPANGAQTRILGHTVSKLALKVVLIVASDFVTFIASAISLYCALADMHNAIKSGNTGLAIGHGIMAIGFASMTAGAGLALMGHASLITTLIATWPFFILGLIAVLIGAGVAYAFTESAIESWLQACPWGKEKYLDDDANTSSIRASQWRNRPDYCLLDLYNVLYSPQLNISSNPLVKQVEISLQVPKVATINGLNFKLSWRKLSAFLGSPESNFQEITLKQLEKTAGSWQMLLNRSGWQYRVSYQQLINALGLQERDNIELKAEVTVYPEGEGALVLPSFDSDLSLPLTYKKQGQETSYFWQNDTREVHHQYAPAISCRSVVLDNRSLYQYHHYGF